MEDLEYILKIVNFNPRTPCGVRRSVGIHQVGKQIISIHAPLAGCDRLATTKTAHALHFNPRTPCGVRRLNGTADCSNLLFQSTHPLRGATVNRAGKAFCVLISIHAPLAGCDSKYIPCQSRRANFNPRTPCGVRPKAGSALSS